MEMAIPFRLFGHVLSGGHPQIGDRWRLNLNRLEENMSIKSQWSQGIAISLAFTRPIYSVLFSSWNERYGDDRRSGIHKNSGGVNFPWTNRNAWRIPLPLNRIHGDFRHHATGTIPPSPCCRRVLSVIGRDALSQVRCAANR